MSNVLANGVIFSSLKHTDPHTGKLVSMHFETGHSVNLIVK